MAEREEQRTERSDPKNTLRLKLPFDDWKEAARRVVGRPAANREAATEDGDAPGRDA